MNIEISNLIAIKVCDSTLKSITTKVLNPVFDSIRKIVFNSTDNIIYGVKHSKSSNTYSSHQLSQILKELTK